jgi:hypothetical protein
MKKLTMLTTMGLLGLSIYVSAQEASTAKKKYIISKGTKLMIANVSGNYFKPNPGYGSGNIAIGEQSGYFVMDNLSVGICMGYDYSYSKNDVVPLPNGNIYTVYHTHTVLPGVFLRYYKMFSPKFGLLGQFQALYAGQFMNRQSNDQTLIMKDQYMGFDLNITPRLVYFITNKLAIEGGFGSINYGFRKNMDGNFSTHTAGFALNPNLTFGLSLYFGKGVVVKD